MHRVTTPAEAVAQADAVLILTEGRAAELNWQTWLADARQLGCLMLAPSLIWQLLKLLGCRLRVGCG